MVYTILPTAVLLLLLLLLLLHYMMQDTENYSHRFSKKGL